MVGWTRGRREFVPFPVDPMYAGPYYRYWYREITGRYPEDVLRLLYGNESREAGGFGPDNPALTGVVFDERSWTIPSQSEPGFTVTFDSPARYENECD
jgi:hypothetical protein